jgi:pimeloyl-ACP methyl ester carboxylesterase
VTSKDGTSIAYDRQGSGPAVILVGGAFVDRSENAPSLRNWRSRSPSTTTTARPWRQRRHPAVRRGSEIEDLEALIAEAGGSAHLYGISSGGALALEAAAAGASVDKLAVYEVPYNTADDGPRRQREYVEQLGALLAQERRR